MLIRFDPRDAQEELGDAAAQIAEEVAVELANNLRIEAPVGATGRLQESFQLFRRGGGVVFLGSRVPYAYGVWKGKPPHEPDFEAIRKWSRRKLGDESAAGPVYSKIKEEGTDANPFVDRAVDNTLQRVSQMRFDQL
jgi:hypothetical protein